jgi:cell division protein FtsB
MFRKPLKQVLVRSVRYIQFAVIAGGLVCLGVLMGQKGLAERSRLIEQCAALRAENHALEESINRLERRVTLLRTNPRSIEKAAKRKLGMARPDEEVYIFGRSNQQLGHSQ